MSIEQQIAEEATHIVHTEIPDEVIRPNWSIDEDLTSGASLEIMENILANTGPVMVYLFDDPSNSPSSGPTHAVVAYAYDWDWMNERTRFLIYDPNDPGIKKGLFFNKGVMERYEGRYTPDGEMVGFTRAMWGGNGSLPRGFNIKLEDLLAQASRNSVSPLNGNWEAVNGGGSGQVYGLPAPVALNSFSMRLSYELIVGNRLVVNFGPASLDFAVSVGPYRETFNYATGQMQLLVYITGENQYMFTSGSDSSGLTITITHNGDETARVDGKVWQPEGYIDFWADMRKTSDM